MSSDWQAEILTRLGSDSFEALVKDLSQRKKNFLQLVEVLEYAETNQKLQLTSVDTATRHDALRFTVNVLEKMSRNALNRAEIETETHFFLAKLDDHQTLIGLAVKGLLTLVQMVEFPDDLGLIVFNSMEKLSMGYSLQKADRANVYLLAEFLVNRFEKDLVKMGPSVLGTFVHLMSEESEPRNLLICFRTMAKILQRFQIEPLEETAFDAVSCYFPIDFTPNNQEDIESHLKETLISGLRCCLTASPLFAKFSIPLILEKLSSDSADAKEEALNTFVCCCETSPAKDIVTFLPGLWASIRREVLASSSDSIEAAAMSALTALTKVVASGPQQDGSGIDAFLTTLLTDTEQFLKKPELQLQYAVGKILKSISLGSSVACMRIFSSVVPLCIKLFMEQLRTEDRLALISVMSFLLNAAAITSRDSQFAISDKISIAVFFQSLLNEHPQNMITCLSVSGLVEMLKIRTTSGAFLDDDRVSMICVTMMSDIMKYENSGLVDQVVLFFNAVGREMDIEFIYERILPELLKQIQGREVVPIPTRLVNLATALLRTARPKRCPDFISGIFNRVLYLDESGPYVPTMVMYLDIIATYVEQTQMAEEAEILYKIILFPTFKKAILAATSEEVSGFQDIAVLQSLCRIYRGIVSPLTETTFKTLAAKLDQMYLKGDTSYRQITGSDKLLASPFKPLERPYITTHTRCISLLTSIVCSAPKGFIYEHSAWKLELQKMMSTCCFCADEQSSVFAAQCIAGIINRLDDDTALKAFLFDIMEDAAMGKAHLQERRFIRAIIWITKGLVQRSQRDDLCRTLVEKIVLSLKIRKSGEEASDGFRIILDESVFVLNPQMNAVISPLYRQKFFAMTLPILLQSFNNLKDQADDGAWIKRNHLVALSHLLKFSPRNVTKPAMPQVVPLLLQSLISEDTNLLESTLRSWNEILLEANPSAVVPFDTQFIPLLIDKLIDISASNLAMDVRISSIECLQHVSECLPTAPLLPFKQKVLKRLAKCLDDKKRRVREVAVVTRGSWFLVGGAQN